METMFCYAVCLVESTFDYAWTNFACLINYVSTGVGKIIPVQKASSLHFFPSSLNFSCPFLLSFSAVLSVKSLNFQVQRQENQAVVSSLFQLYLHRIYLKFLSINYFDHQKIRKYCHC